MPATLQTELPLSAARLHRPMVKRDGAQNVLEMEDWQLDPLIDQLDGIINVASANCARRDLRFTVVCLLEHQRGMVRSRTDAELMELIFGRPQPLLRAQRVYSRLVINPTHFYDLAREGVIRLAKGSAPRSGPSGGAVVEWSALLSFINQRRVA